MLDFIADRLPRFFFGGVSFHPLPRRARRPCLCRFGVGRSVAGCGANAFAGLARVDLEFVAYGFERHDIGHFDLLGC